MCRVAAGHRPAVQVRDFEGHSQRASVVECARPLVLWTEAALANGQVKPSGTYAQFSPRWVTEIELRIIAVRAKRVPMNRDTPGRFARLDALVEMVRWRVCRVAAGYEPALRLRRALSLSLL